MGRLVRFTPQSLHSHAKARGPRSCLGAGEETNLLPLARIEKHFLGCENPSILATPTEVYWPRIVNNRREKSKNLVETFEERYYLRDLGVDGRISIWILTNSMIDYDHWLRKRASGRLP